MSNGLPWVAAATSHRFLQTVHDIEEDCRRKADIIRTAIRETTGQDLAELHLVLDLGQRVVAETTTKVAFPVHLSISRKALSL